MDEIHGANVRGFLLSTCAAPGLAQCVQGVEQVACGSHWWRQNHVAISQDVLPPPQIYVAKAIVCCLTPLPARAAQPPSAFVE